MEEFWLVGNRNSVACVRMGSDCHIWYERDSASDVTHSGKVAVSAVCAEEVGNGWSMGFELGKCGKR